MASGKPAIDRETVEKVARISRLNLSDKELKNLTGDLKSILKQFETLGRMRTKGVKPTLHPVPMKNVSREDHVEPGLTQKEALAQTKQKEDGYFKGPRVV